MNVHACVFMCQGTPVEVRGHLFRVSSIMQVTRCLYPLIPLASPLCRGLTLHLVQVEVISSSGDKAIVTQGKGRWLEGLHRVETKLEGPTRAQFFLGQPAEPERDREALG